MKRPILIIGSQGQVGWELMRLFGERQHIITTDRQIFDLCQPMQMRKFIREVHPKTIINAAAYTQVDKAESESEMAFRINAEAPGVMAEEAKRLNALLVHFSTDYVFDGWKSSPYTEVDVPNPMNVYGKSKLAGEKHIQEVGVDHLIFRTSWVYGLRGRNFLLTMQKLFQEKEELKVVADQVGAPTWSHAIAEAVYQILQCKNGIPSGVYHLTAGGKTSWYHFAEAILKKSGRKTVLKPIPSREYLCGAKRPLNSVLSNGKLEKTFGIQLADWDQMLQAVLK